MPRGSELFEAEREEIRALHMAGVATAESPSNMAVLLERSTDSCKILTTMAKRRDVEGLRTYLRRRNVA